MTFRSGLAIYRDLHILDLCSEVSKSMGGDHMLLPPVIEQFRTRFVRSFRSFANATERQCGSFSRNNHL